MIEMKYLRSTLVKPCPHCNSGVSLFSPSVNRLRPRDRKCPHCGASVRANFRHKKALRLSMGVALILVITAPTLSPLYGRLVLMAGEAVVVIVGIVALTKFELVFGESQEKH
jgi:hypothetical protein